jgi:hypothetical protein
MLRPLARAFAALAVPLLRPLVDALAEEWIDGQDEEAENFLHAAHQVRIGFGLPTDLPEEGPEE